MNNIKPSVFVFIIFAIVACAAAAFVIFESYHKQDIEVAYFEGQRDALEGDIRIFKTSDSCYIWIKSPWSSGEAPIYNPNNDCLFKQ